MSILALSALQIPGDPSGGTAVPVIYPVQQNSWTLASSNSWHFIFWAIIALIIVGLVVFAFRYKKNNNSVSNTNNNSDTSSNLNN